MKCHAISCFTCLTLLAGAAAAEQAPEPSVPDNASAPKGGSIVERERPSTIIITSDPVAEVYLDGAFVSLVGDRFAIEVASGIHRVSVAESGHKVWSQVIDVKPGQRLELQPDLVPTAQRRVATGLFLAGAAALASAVVLSTLALRFEAGIQEFRNQRKRGNYSGRQLDRYNDEVALRNRLKLAAPISLAGAFGCLVTSGVLYEVDEPDAELLLRSTRPDPGDTSSLHVTLRLGLAPMGPSVAVTGTF